MSVLTFDSASHTYRLDGIRLPGVTHILDALGLTPTWPDGPYRARGTAVHKATRLLDEGRLGAISESLEPYVEAYRTMRREIPMRVVLREEPRYHPVMLYAGTVDIAAVDCPLGEHCILDLKVSDSEPVAAYGLQVMGYAPLAFPHVDPRKVTRVIITLRSDGEWRPYFYKREGDWAAWHAAVELYRWKENCR